MIFQITSAGSFLPQPIAPPRRKRSKKLGDRKLSTASENQLLNTENINFCKTSPQAIINDPSYFPTSTTNCLPVSISTATDHTTKKIEILPSPATLHAITREIENSFKDASCLIDEQNDRNVPKFTGSLSKISSSPSYHCKSSPNSVKSNSAPGRVNSVDPNLTMNIRKVIQGNFCVKPQDELINRGEGQIIDNRKLSITDDMEKVSNIRNDMTSERFRWCAVGSNSLGNEVRYRPNTFQDSKERRKSAGDEEIFKQLQLNLNVRMRSESGKQLTDKEILDQVPVKNLDTGENFPLSVADEKAEQCINPLSLYIMQYASHIRESDEESIGGITIGSEIPAEEEDNEEEGRLRRKTARIKKFFKVTAQKAANKAKSIASEVSHARHKEDIAEIPDVSNPEQTIKIRSSKTNAGPYEFAKLQHVQDLSGEQTGAVWCMKFSPCGRMLATGGQDKLLRIWVLKDALYYFEELFRKYNVDQKSSPTPSQESLVSHQSYEESTQLLQAASSSIGPFVPLPYRTYSGHTSDLLDVSWSKSYFILSSSMDKTVRLWHISRKECLCCFQHIEFVTAIAFHPQDDSFFLSGSLDGRLRLWNIPNKKVFLWNEIDGRRQLITAVNFCQNGKFTVIGTYDGRCLFYTTEQLK
jgi:WD repeat-containing protein 44